MTMSESEFRHYFRLTVFDELLETFKADKHPIDSKIFLVNQQKYDMFCEADSDVLVKETENLKITINPSSLCLLREVS
jgi:hypothetical protein